MNELDKTLKHFFIITKHKFHRASFAEAFASVHTCAEVFLFSFRGLLNPIGLLCFVCFNTKPRLHHWSLESTRNCAENMLIIEECHIGILQMKTEERLYLHFTEYVSSLFVRHCFFNYSN